MLGDRAGAAGGFAHVKFVFNTKFCSLFPAGGFPQGGDLGAWAPL